MPRAATKPKADDDLIGLPDTEEETSASSATEGGDTVPPAVSPPVGAIVRYHVDKFDVQPAIVLANDQNPPEDQAGPKVREGRIHLGVFGPAYSYKLNVPQGTQVGQWSHLSS